MESSNQDPIIRDIPAQIVLGAVAFGKPKPTTRDHPLASDEACHDLIEHFCTRGGRSSIRHVFTKTGIARRC